MFKRYNYDIKTMKLVLHEGARANNILRINDECFTKMVDILDLPYDTEDEEIKDPDKLPTISDRSGIESESLNLDNSKSRNGRNSSLSYSQVPFISLMSL
jgi:hypothetical protein